MLYVYMCRSTNSYNGSVYLINIYKKSILAVIYVNKQLSETD